MLTSKLRSQLAGFANKPRLYSRVFSTAPVSRLPIDLVKAVEGKVDLGWTPELVTMEGINRVAAYDSHIPTCEAKRFVRGIASLKAGTAHNCRLIYTMEILECLPRQGYGDFQLQAITAREIIGHHQQRALHRAGIFDPWLVLMHGTHHEYSKLGISFRLPIEEDPMAFHDCIRAAGLVTGQFEVMVPPTDVSFWEQVLERLRQSV